MRSRIARPIPLLLGSNLAATAAGGVFFLVASWVFSLSDMGVYVLAISIQWLIVGLLGTGVGIAVVRLSIERYTQEDVSGAAAIAMMAAAAAAGAGLLLGIAGVTALALGLATPFTPFSAALVATWGGARAVLECLRSSILAREEYRRAAALTVAGAAAGLIALGSILVAGPLTLERILLAHTIGQVASAAIAMILLAPLWKVGPALTVRLWRALLSYAKWPTLSEGAKLLQAHVGPLVLVMVVTTEEAGLYGLGRYPALVFGVVGLSLFQYWLPQAAIHGTEDRIGRFLRRHMRLAAVTAVGMVAAAALTAPLLPFLGKNLGAGAPLMVPNALDFALVVLLLPIEAAYHGIRRPHLDTYVRLAKIPVLLTLAFVLSTRFGALGMIWAQVITGAVALLIAYGVLRRYVDLREPDTPDHTSALD